MFSQTSAFLTRSIRQESRLLSHHLVRGGMVVLMLYLLTLQLAGSLQFGASGLKLISSVMQCCYWCLTLLGVMYFSVAITEEKEEDTLPLLRMTGIRNVTLLLGKSLPRLAVVVLLILVAAPFLMLAVTLGGVVSEQIISSLLGLFCYAFCLCQAGLFASTVCRNSSRAVSSTFLLWLLLEFGCWLFYLGAIGCNVRGLRYLGSQLLMINGYLWERTMWNASGTYLMFDRGEAIWHPQMTFHLTVGLGFFLLSLRLFERFNHAAIAQGAVASGLAPRGIQQKVNSLQSRRSWNAALEWKSWQFEAGGAFSFWLWMFGLPGLAVLVVGMVGWLSGVNPAGEAYGATAMAIGAASLAVQLARLFGNVFNREIYQQTLASLCMVPKSRGAILWRMVVGLLPHLLPSFVCFGIGFFVTLWYWSWFFQDFCDTIDEPLFWASLGWVVVTVHLGVLLSVYFRHGAMLIAVSLCWLVLPIMLGVFLGTMGIFFRTGPGRIDELFLRYLFPCAAMVAECVFCVVLQRLILHRVEEVAGK